MATVLWADIHPLVLPELPGCPTATVNSALAATASDFCARTHIWREALDFQYTIRNVEIYDVDGAAVIESVNSVVVDGSALDHLDVRHVDKTKLTATGKPTSFWVVDDRAIRLFPIPEVKERMDIQVILKPSRDADGIEDWIYESYVDYIAYGAIARLTRISDKDWSNPGAFMYYTAEYEKGITASRIRDLRNVPLRATARPFGG